MPRQGCYSLAAGKAAEETGRTVNNLLTAPDMTAVTKGGSRTVIALSLTLDQKNYA
jgi:hypothetical protein